MRIWISKWRLFLATGGFFFASFAWCLPSQGNADEIPKALDLLREVEGAPQIPSFEFVAEDGTRVSISDFFGKTVVLNLWATWCAPCVKEMPALDRLAFELPEETHVVLAVSQDKGGPLVARRFIDRLGLKKLLANADPQGILMRTLGVRGLPTTLIIASDGRLIARLEGIAEWDHPDAIKFISSIGSDNGWP